jgi:hypothetical protein
MCMIYICITGVLFKPTRFFAKKTTRICDIAAPSFVVQTHLVHISYSEPSVASNEFSFARTTATRMRACLVAR